MIRHRRSNNTSTDNGGDPKVVRLRTKQSAPKFQWMRTLWRDPRVTGNTLKVGLELIEKYKEKFGGFACPSVKLLAEILGVDQQAVKRATKKLGELGYFRVEKTDGKPNRYYPTIPEPECTSSMVLHEDELPQ